MMKKIFKWLAVILLTVFGVVLLFLYHLKPSYSGSEVLPGLADKVDVYFDTYGIPHIYADSEEDAMKALGYLHAKERLWQMELVSRIAPGRLSEIFGKKLLAVDRFYISLGIAENAKKTVAQLDTTSRSYKMTRAYLDGVNAYVDQGVTPIEFYILGLKKRHFTIEDIYNVYGYMAYGFAMANQTDPLISAIRNKLGDEYVMQMDLDIDKKKQLIHSAGSVGDSLNAAQAISSYWREVRKKLPVPVFIGSNSWVLAPSKTKNHKVILENDPHIAFSQPGVWYEAHIQTPDMELYGFYLALNPYPLLGHNHRFAYGLTMLENDDMDLYLEKTSPEHPGQYEYGGKYLDFKTREEVIPVKGGKEEKLIVRESIHGPVMNDVVHQIKTSAPVSMYWIYTQVPNRLNDAIYKMSRSKNIREFRDGVSLIHAPGLNVMYGDREDNIAWWAAAQLFRRKFKTSTKMLIDGSLPEAHQIEFLDFSHNPHAVNPPWNYVYSCNNQPDTIPGHAFVPGYYLPEDRARRVVENISTWKSADMGDCMQLCTDDTSSTAHELVPVIIQNIRAADLDEREKQCLEILSQWDYSSGLNSVGVSIYSKFIYEFLKAEWEDEMGEEIFNEFHRTFMAMRMIAPLIKGKYPVWTDDVRTKNVKEGMQDIQTRAFKNAVAQLTKLLGENPSSWQWKRLHTLEHKHPLGEVKLFRKFFNAGPFSMPGNKWVLNNQMYKMADDYYQVEAGPSTRRVIDFSDVEHSKAILPTGQSGNPLSPHYKDQSEMYNKGIFRYMYLNKEEITANGSLLELMPE